MYHNANYIHIREWSTLFSSWKNKPLQFYLVVLKLKFIHSHMITGNTSDDRIMSPEIHLLWPNGIAAHVSFQITLNFSREFSLQMVNYGFHNGLQNCGNLALTCPLTPKQAPERQMVFISLVFCLHWWQDVPCKHSLAL